MIVGVAHRDVALTRFLGAELRGRGHRAVAVPTGQRAVTDFGVDAGVSVIVLDTQLADATGQETCRTLRAQGQRAPVLFLSRSAGRPDRLGAFAAGADDYVTVPFDLCELLARLTALARRWPDPSPGAPGLRLDPASHAVRTEAGEQLLTPTEFRVLAAIAAQPAEVVRRDAVAAAAWPASVQVAPNTLDSYIRRVRHKLELVGSPVGIHTVRGVGFRLT